MTERTGYYNNTIAAAVGAAMVGQLEDERGMEQGESTSSGKMEMKCGWAA